MKPLSAESRAVDQFQRRGIVDAGALLKDCGLDAILWGGTSGTWSGKGFKADQTLCEEIGRVTGVPASTASIAQVEVLKHYGRKHFCLGGNAWRAPPPKSHVRLEP